MPEDDWIAVLIRGELTLTLPELTLVQAGSPRFHGSGRLVWNQKSGVKIHAVTDGAEELRKGFGRGGSVGKWYEAHKMIHITHDMRGRFRA